MKWETPRVLVQSFEPNEYVASCWGVGCTVNGSDIIPSYDYVQGGGKHGQGGKVENNTHSLEHCGFAGNQVIYDDNGDGVADRMVEVGTDGLGTLACTLYSDKNYSNPMSVSSVKVGQTIYWTTESGARTWHHTGTVTATVPGHPNRS